MFQSIKWKESPQTPPIKLSMQAIMAGGSASRLRKDWTGKDGSFNGMTSLLLNFIVKKKEQKDRPAQTKKRTTVLNRLIKKIPKYGPKAKAKLKDKQK